MEIKRTFQIEDADVSLTATEFKNGELTICLTGSVHSEFIQLDHDAALELSTWLKEQSVRARMEKTV